MAFIRTVPILELGCLMNLSFGRTFWWLVRGSAFQWPGSTILKRARPSARLRSRLQAGRWHCSNDTTSHRCTFSFAVTVRSRDQIRNRIHRNIYCPCYRITHTIGFACKPSRRSQVDQRQLCSRVILPGDTMRSIRTLAFRHKSA